MTLITSRALARSAAVFVATVWVVVTLPFLSRLRRREWDRVEDVEEEDELLELEEPSDEERPHRAMAASTTAASVPLLLPRPQMTQTRPKIEHKQTA